MPSIGKLAVKLEADALAFERGLDGALRKAERFGKGIGRVLTSPLSSAGKLLSAPAAGIGGLVGGITEGLKAIPIVGTSLAAIPLSGASLQRWLQNEIDDMAALSKQATRLGVSLDELSAIQILAGSSAEALERGMLHFRSVLGQAALGVEDSQKRFERLGLDWRDLIDKSPAQAMATVGDKLKGFRSEAVRAALAAELFGEKATAQMLPALEKGTAGLQAALDKVHRFGLFISDSDLAGVLQAKAAFKDLELLARGISRSFAIELAPIAATLTRSFVDWVESLGGVRSLAHEIAEGFRKGLVIALQVAQEIVGAAEQIASAAGKGKSLFSLPGALLSGDVAGTALGLHSLGFFGGGGGGGAGEPSQAGQAIAKLITQLQQLNPLAGAASKQVIGAGVGFGYLASQIRPLSELLAGPINELEAKLKGQLATFGLGANALERWKLANMGATAEQLRNVDALIQQANALEKLKALAEQVKTPLDKLGELMEAIDKQGQAGLLLGGDQNAIIARAFRDVEASLPKLPQAPQALLAGSAGAISAVNEANRVGEGGGSIQERILDVLRQARDLQRRTAETNQQIADALRNQVVVDF
jgi:hypothetical protein